MKRINSSFYVLILSSLTVGLVLTAVLNKVSSLFTSKSLFLCQKFISDMMLEIPRPLPNILILAVGTVLGAGFLSFSVQLVKTRVFLKKMLIKKTSISPAVERLLETLKLKKRVILVEDDGLFSFCWGIIFPSIVVSTGLVKSLTTKELEAVLLHEQSHLIRRDPAKVLLGKTFSSMFFFLPIFRELHKDSEAVNELLADQWVISCQKNSIFLRGALKKILAAPEANLAAVSNVSGPDYFEIRIHRLVDPGTKHKLRPSSVSLITTLLFILVSWFSLQTPASAFHAGTMDADTYLLCSHDHTCSEECKLNIEQPTKYIPADLFIPEKTCENE